MTSLTHTIKHKSLLLKCFAISVMVHLSAALYFYTHPILLSSTWKSLFHLSSSDPELLTHEEDLKEVQNLIEEAFQHILVLPHHLQSPLDLITLPQGIPLAPSVEEQPPTSLASRETPLLFEEEIHTEPFTQISDLTIPETHIVEPLFLPKKTLLGIASQLNIDAEPHVAEISSLLTTVDFADETGAQDADLVAVSDFVLEALPVTDQEGVNVLDRIPLLALENEDLHLKTDTRSQLGIIQSPELGPQMHAVPTPLFVSQGTPAPPLTATHTEREIALELPSLEEYAFPTLATAAQWNDDFDARLQFFPKEEGKGYTFSISLSPAFDISEYSLKQNIYFILDRSNSVQKHRFAVFKRAVIKALASMQPGDAFNIYVVDKKVVSLSPTPLKHSAKALRTAEEFLERQEAGGHFATADIYSTLHKILPQISHDDEINTAILLTDGSSLLSTSRQQKLLTQWVEKNSGMLSLYTAAVGQKNNLVMLDLLSSISGGRLLYSDTHASFPRKLAKLILDLRDPIASDLIVSAIPDNPHAHIEMTTASSHLPSLYCRQPYVIVGSIDEPCNFELILQGRHGAEWVAIKKNISFIEGEKATRAQAKKWEAQEVSLCYSQFLKEGKSEQLKQAKEILKSTRTEIAFE